jgi:hypothetical protein
VFEAVLIMLSILLALAVNEWRDGRQLQEHVRQTRAAFSAEVRANRTELAAAETGLPYHRRLWARYRELARLTNPGPADMARVYAEFPYGIPTVQLRDAVWRSLAGSDIVRSMEQRDLFTLAEVYRQQERIDDYNRAMYSAWRQIQPAAGTPGYLRDEIRSTTAYLGDLVAAEERLAGRYDAALRRLTTER